MLRLRHVLHVLLLAAVALHLVLGVREGAGSATRARLWQKQVPAHRCLVLAVRLEDYR